MPDSVGIKVEDYKHGKVIRTDVSEPVQFDESKVPGSEYVIQRVVHEGMSGVERVVQPSADPRVEQSSDSLKETRAVRQGNVVEITTDNDRFISDCCCLLCHQQQLGIA